MPMATQTECNGPRRTLGLAAAIVGSGALAAVIGTADPAVAETAKWGGIAYSESTGAFGFSFGNRTPEDAKQRALRHCRARSSANDCRVARSFAGQCGGLAVLETSGKSPSGLPKVVRVFSVATAKTRAAAETDAVAKCRIDHKKLNAQGDGCMLITSICSNGQ